MVEKRICCCGSRIWTKVIAWLEIIGSALALIVYVLAMVHIVALLTKFDNPDIKKRLSPEKIHAMKTELIPVVVVTALKLFLNSLSFVMGIVLLVGALRKNTHFICAWMVYSIIAAIFSTVMALFATSKTAGDQFVAYLVGIALAIAIQGFCVWVVGIHKNEIDAQRESLESAEVQYDVRKASI